MDTVTGALSTLLYFASSDQRGHLPLMSRLGAPSDENSAPQHRPHPLREYFRVSAGHFVGQVIMDILWTSRVPSCTIS